MTQDPTNRPASGEEREIAKAARRKNKLSSIRNELEGKKVIHFDQIFAIFSETRLAEEVGVSFYTFRKKVNDPRAFTVGELIRLAELFGVEYNIISDFIQEQIRAKNE